MLNGFILGIDGIRLRSGGGVAHLLGILQESDPREAGIREVHIWTYQKLIDQLPDYPWLIVHHNPAFESGILNKIYWQMMHFKTELRDNGCNLLFCPDSGSISAFSPRVVMSQDLLPFSFSESLRYGLSVRLARVAILRLIYKFTLGSADGVIFLTDFASSEISKKIHIHGHTKVIPHGIGREFFLDDSPARRSAALESDGFRCVYVSNAEFYKNHIHVVEAARILQQRGFPLKLFLPGAGTGPAAHLVEKSIRSADPGGKFITTTNFLPHNAIPNILHTADIAIFASSCENLPVTLLEAMASGLPIACSNSKPMPDILNGCGVLFDPKNPLDIASALEQLFTQPKQRAELAMKAKQNARNYSWHKSGAETWHFLSSVLESANTNKKREYRICSNCVMDTSDSGICFDSKGVCDYCNNYHSNIFPNWHPDERGEKEIMAQVEQIKREGKEREHDCILGISGGVDSSYLAYLAKEKFGLRPLIFHVDAGWNSQQAVHNIECMVDALGLDLYTEVVNWSEMKDLQLSFFKANVPHLDTPQDHAFFASLYNFAAKHGIKYILNGGNYSTECIREPLEWHYHASDLRQLRDIHRRFGAQPLKTFPLADIFTYKIYYRYVKGIQVVKPLNYVPYIKEDAMQILVDKFGWQPYTHKHYESRFTRFYEGYWLPTKFGFDKRRAHFSSLILTNQMTREEALEKIAKPAYDEATITQDFEYVATKLDISVAELQGYLNASNKSYRDYKSAMPLIHLGTQVMRALRMHRGIIR